MISSKTAKELLEIINEEFLFLAEEANTLDKAGVLGRVQVLLDRLSSVKGNESFMSSVKRLRRLHKLYQQKRRLDRG